MDEKEIFLYSYEDQPDYSNHFMNNERLSQISRHLVNHTSVVFYEQMRLGQLDIFGKQLKLDLNITPYTKFEYSLKANHTSKYKM